MVPTASSQTNRRTQARWQDKIVAAFWLPFSLLFDLWVYFTPTYAEKWGFSEPSQSRRRSLHPLHHSFLIVALLTMSVLGFALFALRTVPPVTSRLVLVAAFGLSFRQFLRAKT